MTTEPGIVIVGAGHAGGRAAQALRQAGFAGAITLVGDETWAPYERPPLSKELLVNDSDLAKAYILKPEFYAENNITLKLGNAATAIDRTAKTVTLTDGTVLPYAQLLLTTGARVRKLPVPGADLPGLFYVRDFNDTLALRPRLVPGAKVVVIGGGFIGLETAASASKRGASVTVLEGADRLMGRAVAPEIGQYFADLHAAKGVTIRLGVGVEAIAGDGQVAGVRLRGGEVVPADVVVVGIGILPNVELAQAAGLAVENGIVVDVHGRTSDPAIWAAGDVANQPHAGIGRRVRLESYQNAQNQSMTVGRNMAGQSDAYEDNLWVWSDQHDVNLQMTGFPEGYDDLVWRGDKSSGSFMLFYMRQGRVIAVNTVNLGREMRPAQRLMTSGRTFTAEQLADPATKLINLSKA